MWRWSTAPDRYLETVLRMEVEARPDLRLVDSMDAVLVAVTLLSWQVESVDSPRLAGAMEITATERDRSVHTQLVRRTEPYRETCPAICRPPPGACCKAWCPRGSSSSSNTADDVAQ